MYKNDGNGKFSDQKISSSKTVGAIKVYPSDLDGDGDIDVLSAPNFNPAYCTKILWFKRPVKV